MELSIFRSRTAQSTLWVNRFCGFRIRLTEVRSYKDRRTPPQDGIPHHFDLEITEVDGTPARCGPTLTPASNEAWTKFGSHSGCG